MIETDPIKTAMAPEMLRDVESIMRVKYPELEFEPRFHDFYMQIVSVGRMGTASYTDPFEAMRAMQYNVFATVFIAGWESALLALARRPPE